MTQYASKKNAVSSNNTVVRVTDNFLGYFQKDRLKSDINESVRTDVITADILKHAVDWKAKSLEELVSILEDIVNAQLKDIYGSISDR